MKVLTDSGVSKLISKLPSAIRGELNTELTKLGKYNTENISGELHITGPSFEIIVIPHIVFSGTTYNYTYKRPLSYTNNTVVSVTSTNANYSKALFSINAYISASTGFTLETANNTSHGVGVILFTWK